MRFNSRYLFSFILFFIVAEARAQHEGFIYGEIKLKNKQVYTGQIRWSGGQLLWSDVLLVARQVNPNLKYLNEYQLKHLAKEGDQPVLDWKFMNLWKDKYPERKSEILSRFGDIALIHVTGIKEAQLYYKSGNKIRITTDEHEDRQLGKDLVVYNNGQITTIKWSAISTVKFLAGPQHLDHFKGNPLYGTVMTTKGPLTGFIQWDKVKNPDNQSVGNKGIIVMHPLWGRIIVSWKAFRSVRFEHVPDHMGYDAYSSPKKIYAIVITKDKKVYKGNCVFDMDEEWNCELLEGNKDGMSYQLSFKYISKLVPINESYSNVVLSDHQELILGHHNDVTAKNWGILVWQSNSGHQYIPWNMISEISFR